MMGARPNKVAPLTTVEAFEIAVSSSGNDPVTPGSVVFSTQAEATAWGAFATIAAAIASIPDRLVHLVTVRLPTGTWVLGSEQLGNLARLEPSGTGWLRIAGNDSWSQVAGTPASIGVASSDGAGNVTLDSDPSLTANAYEGYYLLVLSGTSAGSFKPLVTHSGTAMKVAGGFPGPLDDSSVVQIVERATTIEVDDNPNQEIRLHGSGNTMHSFFPMIEFYGVNIIPESGEDWWWFNAKQGTLMLDGGTRLVEGGPFGGMFNVLMGDVVIDVSAGSWGFEAISIQGGLVRTSWGSSRPMLLIGDGTTPDVSAITVGTVGDNSGLGVGAGVYLFGAQHFSKWTEAFIKAEYIGATVSINISGGVPLRSDQSADHALLLVKGAYGYISNIASWAASTFRGSSSDVSLDGDEITWADIDTAGVAANERGSRVMEN